VVELLGTEGIDRGDNPHTPARTRFVPEETLYRIRAWEEAPLLDDLSVTAGYRGTVVNLGLAADASLPSEEPELPVVGAGGRGSGG
jgi:hypothetical protein